MPFSSRPLPPLPESLEFLRLLWALEHALQAASKRMRVELGVTGPQRTVLRLLGCDPTLGPKELAALLHDHPSTLTGVLQRLAERGFIFRHVDATDRRRAVLSLTDEGRAIDTVREGTVEDAVERALRRLSPDRVAAAREVLSAIMEEMETQRR